MNINKFYIKQFIINKQDNFQEWSEVNLTNYFKDSVIIGYLFTTNKSKALFEKAYILNIYFIKQDKYHGKIVTLEALEKAWKLFFIKEESDTTHKYVTVFKNPPVEQWLDTKDNWCKKIASELSNIFNWKYDDTLSEVYKTIMECYCKGTVYLGNLSYLKKSIYNSILMKLRANKIRLNGDNYEMQSLDLVLNSNGDDDEITLGDIIAADDTQTEDSLEYKLLLEQIKKMLSVTFSPREIEQILTYKPNYLPLSLYRRLLKWRESHKVEDIYE